MHRSHVGSKKVDQYRDWATGGEVTYQYDVLERLISAATVSSAWGLRCGYDGFGYSYDGNGNLLTMPQQSGSMTYDRSNRMVTFTNQNDTESYQYAPDNKRVWRSKGCSYQSVVDGSTQVAPTLTFYSVFGQKLGDYCYPPSGGQVVEENVHFGGRIVAKGDAGGSLAALATDRLHSKGDGSTFFPYGETKSGTAITGDSFATYSRDWTGLDYADQRWYSPAVGRFTSSDPFMRSAKAEDSGSWNRFSYVRGNPINRWDPKGLEDCDIVASADFYCEVNEKIDDDVPVPQDPPPANGGGAVHISARDTTTQQQRSTARNAISRLKDDCKGTLDGSLSHLSSPSNPFITALEALTSLAETVYFYNVEGQEGGITLEVALGHDLGIAGETVYELWNRTGAQANAIAGTISYAPDDESMYALPHVILGRRFGDIVDDNYRQAIILHELLHVAFGLSSSQTSHLAIAQYLGLAGQKSDGEANVAINQWLLDCLK